MKSQETNRLRRFRLRSRRSIALIVLSSALVIGVPLAYASDLFTDVPDANPFHNAIGAIARAGITTGKTCVPPTTPPTYCPEEFVTREAMAAFMHRGYGRVAYKFLPIASVPAAPGTPAGWALDLTAGLPANALVGAAAFIKIDGEVSVCNNTATPRVIHARVRLDGGEVNGDNTFLSLDVDSSPGECGNLALNGVGTVTTTGVHTASVLIDGGDGAAVLGDGHLTMTYFPFGSTGTNTLGTTGAAGSASDIDK
jgi:hypothetical protein